MKAVKFPKYDLMFCSEPGPNRKKKSRKDGSPQKIAASCSNHTMGTSGSESGSESGST